MLRNLVPVIVQNDVVSDFKVTKKGLAVISGRFKTRVQQSRSGQVRQTSPSSANPIDSLA
jgi:hypothetical protein